MKNKVFVIMKEDIINYPPAITVIKTLVDLGYQVFHIGNYSDIEQKNDLKNKGVHFIETEPYNGLKNLVSKYIQQYKFRKIVNHTLNEYNANKKDFVWLLNAETIVLLSNLTKNYKTIFHYFEFTTPYVNWKYRLVNPYFNPYKANRETYRIIQCEYNRAHIFKAFLHLNELPIIMPNKPYEGKSDNLIIPIDIMVVIDNLKKKIDNRKVILYQGVFQGKDRRLNEFLEATYQLSSDYVFVAMGSDSPAYRELKEKYESDCIIFVPFIRPPYHLEITKLATLGILSYVANEDTVAGVINPIYCAPNKIFEYSKFGKPMLANDLPGLSTIFRIYDCGETIDYPITSQKVAKTIFKITEKYQRYSEGALNFYNSVDIKKCVEQILSDKK